MIRTLLGSADAAPLINTPADNMEMNPMRHLLDKCMVYPLG